MSRSDHPLYSLSTNLGVIMAVMYREELSFLQAIDFIKYYERLAVLEEEVKR